MEDSGIDSDSKSNNVSFIGQENVRNGSFHRIKCLMASEKVHVEDACDLNGYDKFNELTNNKGDNDDNISTTSSKLMTSLQLQKRLEKQIQQARKIRKQARSEIGDFQPKKSLIPRNRLTVPSKSQVPVVTKSDEHPLVTWESESEDEFDFHPMNKSAAREITQQLIKDGYNLDLTPDDEDLDLIPPKPLGHRCTCCSMNYLCSIQ